MNPTAEEKIWLVMEAIANAYGITPSGNKVIIDPLTFNKKITEIELDRILTKLEKDHTIIDIIRRPNDFEIIMDGTDKCFSIIIPDYIAFRKHLNFTHSRHFGGIDRMEANNFLSICDMAMDILSELQIISPEKEEISLKIVPDIIRFPTLLPAKSVGLLERYWDYRVKALSYMQERGYIIDFDYEEEMFINRWDRRVNIKVDRFDFDKFYDQLGIVYQRRVVDPAKKSERKNKTDDKKEPKTKTEPLPMKIEITAMPDLNIKNVEENTIIKGKKRIRLPKFKPTDWSKITIRFLDERNVIINADNKEQVVSDYEALGFANDKQGKPNTAWLLLYGLAKNNGETEPQPSPIPDTIKQQKRQLSDRLKAIFKNDTDPFYDPTESRVYRIKINLIPPQPKVETDEIGVQEYLQDTMTEEYDM